MPPIYPRPWRNRQQLLTHRPPTAVSDWLFDRASLTARLIRLCRSRGRGDFNVRLLDQRLARPQLDEREVLGVRHGRSAIVRQVRLYCGDTPMVYARTVIPVTTLTGKQRLYGNLGNRPLGAMLFADRSMKRDEVMITVLQPGDGLYAATGAADESVWGRRSVFRVGGKPLLVSEYYLPALFAS